MKTINKPNAVPDFFQNYHKHHSVASWDDVDSESRSLWREYILDVEQRGLGAYTEAPCVKDTSHIDHFKKRSDFPQLTFCWSNMFVDETNEKYGARFKDRKSRLDYSLLISPATANVERFFEYYEDGSIAPNRHLDQNSTERARYTIDTFNLNHPALKGMRCEIFDTFFSVTSRGDASQLAESFANAHYGFPSVVQQILKDMGEA